MVIFPSFMNGIFKSLAILCYLALIWDQSQINDWTRSAVSFSQGGSQSPVLVSGSFPQLSSHAAHSGQNHTGCSSAIPAVLVPSLKGRAPSLQCVPGTSRGLLEGKVYPRRQPLWRNQLRIHVKEMVQELWLCQNTESSEPVFPE